MFPSPVGVGSSSYVHYCKSSGISHWPFKNSQYFWRLQLESQKSVVSRVLYNNQLMSSSVSPVCVPVLFILVLVFEGNL